ncbi:hypothetical protein NTGBS_250008 [Candidatus Nitrotoga sp. BS]|nr:hypothetical protein NTGBS_250008 [Candidatus Nitrotoga sp. BS]
MTTCNDVTVSAQTRLVLKIPTTFARGSFMYINLTLSDEKFRSNLNLVLAR